MLLSLQERVSGLHRRSFASGVGRPTTNKFRVSRQTRGQATFLDDVNDFPASRPRPSSWDLYAKKIEQCHFGGFTSPKTNHAFNERNHEVPMLDGAATGPSMGQ